MTVNNFKENPTSSEFPGLSPGITGTIPGYMADAMRMSGVEVWDEDIFKEFCETYLGSWASLDAQYDKRLVDPDTKLANDE